MQNLDYIAAKCAETIYKKNKEKKDELKRDIYKSLSIIHLQGIYALFCWLFSEDDNLNIAENLIKMFNGSFDNNLVIINSLPSNSRAEELLSAVKENLTRDLKIMFFARDLISQALIYTKYMVQSS